MIAAFLIGAGVVVLVAVTAFIISRRPPPPVNGPRFTHPGRICPSCGSTLTTARYSGGSYCRQCDECGWIFNVENR